MRPRREAGFFILTNHPAAELTIAFPDGELILLLANTVVERNDRLGDDVVTLKSSLLLVSFLTLSANCLNAGPFGVELGAPIASLDAVGQENKFDFRSVPKPHPLFTNYSGWQTATHGVCRVLAISAPIENDSFGIASREKFEKVKTALTEKYGPGRAIEVLQPGSIWQDPKYWMMSIYKNERTHGADWEQVNSNGEEYGLIQLWVMGGTSSSSAIALEYRSKNFDACNKEIESGLNDSF